LSCPAWHDLLEEPALFGHLARTGRHEDYLPAAKVIKLYFIVIDFDRQKFLFFNKNMKYSTGNHKQIHGTAFQIPLDIMSMIALR